MADVMYGLLILCLGFALGILYFSCLWIAVQNLPRTRHPVVLMIGSGAVRLTIAMAGFYLLVGGHWQRLLIILVGFLLARTFLIVRWRPQTSLAELSRGE
jgi:F1F0 ATPase subunit 2